MSIYLHFVFVARGILQDMVRRTGPVTPVSSQIQEEGVFSSDS